MRVTRIALLLGLMVAATVVAVNGAAAAPGGPPGSRVVGQVYVNDNTAPVNTVAGFDRHADGTLTALPGSPSRFTAAPRRGCRCVRRALA